MPTVTYTCPETGKEKKQIFPYNAMGKAQAFEFARRTGGSMENNPNYGMEVKTKSSGY